MESKVQIYRHLTNKTLYCLYVPGNLGSAYVCGKDGAPRKHDDSYLVSYHPDDWEKYTPQCSEERNIILYKTKDGRIDVVITKDSFKEFTEKHQKDSFYKWLGFKTITITEGDAV